MASAFSCGRSIDLNDPAKGHKISKVKNLEIEYYDVRGSTAEEIREQMDKLGPADQYGKSRDAFTQWHLKWSWPFDKSEKPIFSKAKSQISFKIVLPRWIPNKDASEDLLKSWTSMYLAMLDHEYNHVKYALDGAPKVAKAIRKAYAVNPQLTKRDANAAASVEVKKMKAKDIDYDIETESGRFEGVVFPAYN